MTTQKGMIGHVPWDGAAIQKAIEYVESRAPTDVLATVSWVRADGWQAVDARGGPSEGFGNVLVEFAKGDTQIRITRDRGQWLMHLRLPGWSQDFDLDIILDTITGRDVWPSAEPFGQPLAEQLPPGVSWAESLPQVLTWLAAAHDIEPVLKQMQLRRSRSMFA